MNPARVLLNLPIKLSFELASSTMPLGEFLRLKPGSVLRFGTGPEPSAAIYAGPRLIARGGLVISSGCLAVQVAETLFPPGRTEGSPNENAATFTSPTL